MKQMEIQDENEVGAKIDGKEESFWRENQALAWLDI